MVLFTRRYKLDGFKPIRFYNQELVITKQVKYLGVIRGYAGKRMLTQSVRKQFLRSTRFVEPLENLGFFAQDSALALHNGNTANDHIRGRGLVASCQLHHS